MGNRITMKINEIIIEGSKGKLQKSQSRAMHRVHAYNDSYDAGNNYNFYRVGMAAAMADGSGKPLDIDDRTWFHNNNITVPYSEKDHEIMHHAFKAVNSDVKPIVKDHRSLEDKKTNKNSPVASKKRNKYGV